VKSQVVAFFNNKGGVGKTSLVYHMAWMLSDLGVRTVVGDLDPQANLTAAFLDESRLEELFEGDGTPATVFGFIQPLMRGIGDLTEPRLEAIDQYIALLPGDLSLSSFEDELSAQWPACLDRKERAFRVISAFWRLMQQAAESHVADLILVDLGPNLGAINRAALIASDFVVIPLSPDLFSLQGLKNLGPTLREWREQWLERLPKNPAPDLALPQARMEPVGYVVLQHAVRLDRPVQAYGHWIERIPRVYRTAVLQESAAGPPIDRDPNCLALLKHYRSLVPMAQEAHKPIFHLKPADGAIGAHLKAVGQSYVHFEKLAREIAGRAGVAIPRLADDGAHRAPRLS
jgi:chromosome partitioning protein